MKSSFKDVVAAVDKLYAKKKFPTMETDLTQVKEVLASHGWEMNEYSSILLDTYRNERRTTNI